MPELMPEAGEYFECFTLCDSQLRAGFGGAYALDWGVVIKVAEAMDMNIDDKFFVMLKAFENAMLTDTNKKTETDNEYKESLKKTAEKLNNGK